MHLHIVCKECEEKLRKTNRWLEPGEFIINLGYCTPKKDVLKILREVSCPLCDSKNWRLANGKTENEERRW